MTNSLQGENTITNEKSEINAENKDKPTKWDTKELIIGKPYSQEELFEILGITEEKNFEEKPDSRIYM
jgi:hypothetical protein